MGNTYLNTAEEYYRINKLIEKTDRPRKYMEMGHAYVGNAAISIECYLKHMIKLVRNEPEVERNKPLKYTKKAKNGALHFVAFEHNILAIARRIELESENTITFSNELKKDLNKINDFYYMRYPNAKKYRDITKEDINLCKRTINKIRIKALTLEETYKIERQKQIDAEKCIEENDEENNLYIK